MLVEQLGLHMTWSKCHYQGVG